MIGTSTAQWTLPDGTTARAEKKYWPVTMQRQCPASSSSSCLRPVPRQNGGHSSFATVTVAENWRFRSCRSWVAHALFDSGYILCVISRSSRMAFGRIPVFLRHWVDSTPEVDSRPALLSSWPRTSSITAVVRCVPDVALCTADAWAAEQFFLENLDIISMSPLCFCSIFSCPQTPLGNFLEPSTTKRSSLSRVRRVAGSPGVRLPGDPPQLVSVTQCIADVM